jgi:hypothetical protein
MAGKDIQYQESHARYTATSMSPTTGGDVKSGPVYSNGLTLTQLLLVIDLG